MDGISFQTVFNGINFKKILYGVVAARYFAALFKKLKNIGYQEQIHNTQVKKVVGNGVFAKINNSYKSTLKYIAKF